MDVKGLMLKVLFYVIALLASYNLGAGFYEFLPAEPDTVKVAGHFGVALFGTLGFLDLVISSR